MPSVEFAKLTLLDLFLSMRVGWSEAAVRMGWSACVLVLAPHRQLQSLHFKTKMKGNWLCGAS